MKRPPSLIYDLSAWLFKLFILIIGRSSKVRVFHLEIYKKYQSQKKPVIFAFWHENLVMPPYLYYVPVGGKRLVSMVSRSRDGEIIAKILEKFRGITVRGSSSRGGATALLEMADKMKAEGWDAAMIPDGPKGPPYSVQEGLFKLAQLSGAPIIPCGIEYARKKRLSSWDKMKIPYLFNRVGLSFGNPIVVSSEVTDFTRLKAQFLEEMTRTTRESERFVLNK